MIGDGETENMALSNTQKAIQQTHEISITAMREQIKFMTDKLEETQRDLEAKEMLIQRIESEKRDALRNYEQIEMQHFELQEKFTQAQVDVEQTKAENVNLT